MRDGTPIPGRTSRKQLKTKLHRGVPVVLMVGAPRLTGALAIKAGLSVGELGQTLFPYLIPAAIMIDS